MRQKRYSVEQTVAKLGQAEKLQADGPTTPQACKRLGISTRPSTAGGSRYGALKEDEAQRPKALEQENGRLKKMSSSRR